jgi:hypothetical protein
MAAMDPSYAGWSADSRHYHRVFWETRLAREHAMATRCTPVSPRFQPGLFDRRAERAIQAGNDLHKALADEVVRHVTAGEQRARIDAKEPGVVLVLVP